MLSFKSRPYAILLLTTAFLLAAAVFLPSATAYAASCDGTETAIIECSDKENGIWNILLLIMQFMTAGVGLLAVSGIVYASVLWTTAEDKQEQITKAKGIITNVVIGLIAFALMWSGLQFIVPGGVFNRAFGFSKVQNATDKMPDTSDGKNNSKPKGSGSKGSDSSGKVTPANIKTVKNLRDASATTTGVLKPGVLYRSAQLTRLNEPNAKKLSKLLGDNAVIIDLRPPGGEGGQPDKNVPGVKHSIFAIQGVLDTAPMVADRARANMLGKALKAAANAKGAVLVHCVAGKDRTGWMVAMIMYANGANDAQVMKEYLKSNDAIPGGVKAEWLKSGVQAARKEHGSVINYLKSIGLTTSDLNKLRKKFGA